MRKFLIAALTFLCSCKGHVTVRISPNAEDPCVGRISFQYFEDITVETDTGEKLGRYDILKLLRDSPHIAHVSLVLDPPRHFSIEALSYPQSVGRYQMTPSEWQMLQDNVRVRYERNRDYAATEVVAHWESILNGKPPFGIQIQGEPLP